MRQSEVNNIFGLKQYLQFRKNNDGKIYHYTNIGNLIKIINSGKLYLNNIKNVNDAMECIVAQPFNMYVASFTYEDKEAVHYWSVYGKGDPYSLRVSVDTQSIAANQSYKTLQNNDLTIQESVISDIIYYNGRKVKDKRKWKHNGQYFSLFNDEDSIRKEFPGLCKYDVWEHEKETRLLVKTNLDENGIFLNLDNAFFASISVIFSPWIDDEVRVELSKMLITQLSKRQNVTKTLNNMRKSSIHNQIRIKG